MLGYSKIKECEKAKGKKKGAKGQPGSASSTEGGDGSVHKGPTVFTRKVTTPIILIPLPSKSCNEGWDYSNKGGDWNCECKEGNEQSPINLPPMDKAIISPIKPIFTFNEVKAKTKERTSSGQFKATKILTMKHKHNALRIKHKYFGKVVTLDGALFTAEQIVFHTPSEHQIDGKTLDMEMQVIYFGKSKGDIAKQVVLSFLFKKKAGVYNKFIDDLDFFNLPNPNTKKKPLLNSLFIPKIFYNADQEGQPILKPFSFYTYQGSLTAPPCSERTIVYVAAKPIKLGTSAIQLFQEAIRVPDKLGPSGEIITSNLPNENNRNIQPLNGRAVFYYDHTKYCGKTKDIGITPRGGSSSSKDIRRKIKVKGHYEKVLKKMTEYFYVNGPRPSGLPGAYVTSSKEAIGNGMDGN
jgi:carbonic anhydrase